MQNRVPTYPGRVTMTPVAGQANTYDMARADQPTQEGTPLNKDTLLKDATATLYALGSDAVPDDVFIKIASLFQKTGKVVTGEYIGTGSQPTIVFESKPLLVVIAHSTPKVFSSAIIDIAIIPAFLGDAKKPSSEYNSSFENAYIYISTLDGTVTTNDLSMYTGGNIYQVENSIRLSGTDEQNDMSINGVTYKYFALLEW